MAQLVLMVIFFGAMMFFFQRSQKKQQQKREETLNSMTPGSHIVTIGGLHGVISEVNTEKQTVIIDCEGIFLEFERSAIRTVTPATTEAAEATTSDVEQTNIETTEKED